MPHLLRSRVPVVGIAALGLGSVLLAGCSGDATPSTDRTTESGAPTTPSTVAPDGTTVPGTVIALGKQAVVRWRADKAHDSLAALTVTAVTRGHIKDLRQFTLSDAVRSSSVYYVSVAVRNVGTGNLSGQPLTLYGKVSRDLVVKPVTFGPTFGRCNDQPLPEKFTNGARARVCMVMLAPRHGRISAIQWRGPGRSGPISWRVS